MTLSVVILTFNEEQHIERCIKSVLTFANEVFVIDSFSSDKTIEIAESLGAKVYQNAWKNYATQFNWGLKNCPIKTQWVMRLDADEFVMPALAEEIKLNLNSIENDVTGIYVKRRVYFMDKWIKHGGYYPIWLLRIWQHKKGYCEERWMDEHVKVSPGKSIHFRNDIVDHNLNGITLWTQKHNGYATREAVDILNNIYSFLTYDDIAPKFFGSQSQRKRWLKLKYSQMPLFLRPFLYFIYRYFFQLGILDGKPGLVWHFLQGFWYRFLVDAKIYEIYFKSGKKREVILQLLKNEYSIDLTIK